MMLENIQINNNSEIDLSLIVLNLLFAFIISILIKFHYKKFSTTLTNRDDFSNLFPFITLTVVLVIYIVKSSLALSLGLVGALSIVRFRTPIKEPEELAYLFICIAAGLGYGANQTIPTTVSIILILILLYLLKIKKIRTTEKNIFLNLELENEDNINTSEISKNINQILKLENDNFNLLKLDVSNELFQATYIINLKNLDKLEKINQSLQSKYPNIKINFVDQNQVPNI
jgi:energy-converting hydrogenase Eha subunit C